MSDFFHGWRRKTGIATLLVACLLTIGWVRSYRVDDFLGFGIGKRTEGPKNFHDFLHVASADGTLYLGLLWYQSGDPAVRDDFARSFRYPVWQTSYAADFPSAELLYKWRCCGFGVYIRTPNDPNNGGTRLLVPYWSIVVPFTLLSAWLLIRKPKNQRPARPAAEFQT